MGNAGAMPMVAGTAHDDWRCGAGAHASAVLEASACAWLLEQAAQPAAWPAAAPAPADRRVGTCCAWRSGGSLLEIDPAKFAVRGCKRLHVNLMMATDGFASVVTRRRYRNMV
jgi:hypothetical protein